MRTKIFLAFLAVIFTALVSNVLYKRLIISDFKEYMGGVQEDRLYWVLASVEGSHGDEGWDLEVLKSYLHWASMLGFDVKVLDAKGKEVLASAEALESLTPTMRRRLSTIVSLKSAGGEHEPYPLYSGGKQIGTLMVRPLMRMDYLAEKEKIFEERGREFLVITFLIAGGGALFLSAVFTLFLTVPLRRLRRAAGKVAGGDLSVRVKVKGSDEIGELGDTFNHMVEALQRDEALRRRLTSNIAHELRTPLAIAKAHIEAISDGVIECGSEELKKLEIEVQRLITLVEGIEDITKAEASFFSPPEYEEVDLGEFLNSMAGGMRHLSSEKDLSIDLSGSDSIRVLADPVKLETVLRNLLVNALRYTEKGSIRLSSGRLGEGSFYIEVSDTGQGIQAKDLPNIFKRFYKGKGSVGAGLGLSIAKELTEIMGGTIEAKSTPGKGTSFRITLPEGSPRQRP